ncbi:hypothetical protein ACJX0J_009410 [Zea mays]
MAVIYLVLSMRSNSIHDCMETQLLFGRTPESVQLFNCMSLDRNTRYRLSQDTESENVDMPKLLGSLFQKVVASDTATPRYIDCFFLDLAAVVVYYCITVTFLTVISIFR